MLDVDKMILDLSKKDKIRIINSWKNYAKTLSEAGRRVMVKRIKWLKKSL